MSQKKESGGSRFDGLLKAAKAHQEEASDPDLKPQPAEADSSIAKHKNPDYQRTTLYLPKRLHRKLKAAAAESDREMSDIMQELVEQWLESRLDV
ncbi:CopG family transcriptional regulator [Candidatus Woesearchaeota archaeon]|nr:CopG family transcriptional regulator [Candidatus Woesearchaeota archaeon]